MCGIAGFSGQFDQVLLSEMRKLLAHRGPDDTGEIFLEDAQVGLAHTRLTIIDLSKEGHQPMTTQCAHCKPGMWLAYNGELYNYRELRRELISAGHTFHSQTDSEVLLHLYAKNGIDMLKRLNGMFAFALYDGENLLIARDGIGIKPLYYTLTTHKPGVLFASELKALLAFKEFSRAIDYTAIHYYLAYLWCPGQQTAFKDIRKLEPGTALIVRHGSIKKHFCFYDLPYFGFQDHETYTTITHKQKKSGSYIQSIAKELHTRLLKAVKQQCMSDVPIGAFLSGGLDSSAIVAMMRRIDANASINCYTIACDTGMQSEGNPDDLPYARKVAQHLGINLKVLSQKADMIEHLDKMIYFLDEPLADPAAIHVYLIAKAACQDGTKVLLSGVGGDDIFSGYRRHQALHAARLLRFLPKFLKQGLGYGANALISGQRNYIPMHHHAFPRRVAKFLSAAHLTQDRQIIHHFLWSTDTLRQTLYSDEMREYLSETDTMQPLLQSLSRIPMEQDPLNRMLYLEAKHFLADHNLNYTDKMAMAVGVEVRVPLLDLELIQYATQIPSVLKQHGETGKFIFKKAMEADLPKDVIYRPKAGFGVPLRAWLHHELKPLVADVLSKEALEKRGLFNSFAIQRLIEQDKKGHIDASYTIFSLLVIELWCRKFVDGRGG